MHHLTVVPWGSKITLSSCFKPGQKISLPLCHLNPPNSRARVSQERAHFLLLSEHACPPQPQACSSWRGSSSSEGCEHPQLTGLASCSALMPPIPQLLGGVRQSGQNAVYPWLGGNSVCFPWIKGVLCPSSCTGREEHFIWWGRG